ncbi:hypothetical protein [Butyrivibrio proteoclasticus]|uniref:ADP-ribosyltransferase-containing protein n=1 Tax=Butyrivibrio proteoclasticus TaxID=43305 RepID=UPI00047BB905|nr:hypothetical protein [Butyrivibrio proteoclasticus]
MSVTSFKDFMKTRAAGAAGTPAVSLSEEEEERRRREEEQRAQQEQLKALEDARMVQRAQSLYNSYMDEAEGREKNAPSFASFMLNKNGVTEETIRSEQAQKMKEIKKQQDYWNDLEARSTGSATKSELAAAQKNIDSLGLTEAQDKAIHEYIEGWGYDTKTGAGASEFLKRSGIDYDTFVKAVDNLKVVETGKVATSSTLTPEETVAYSQHKIDTLSKPEREALNTIVETKKAYDDYVSFYFGNPLSMFLHQDEARSDEQIAAVQKLRDLGWDEDKINLYEDYAQYIASAKGTEEFNKQFDIDPNSSTGAKVGKSAFNTIYDLYEAPIRGVMALGDKFTSHPSGLGTDVNAWGARGLNSSEYATGQVVNNAITDEHPVGQKAYQYGLATAEAGEMALLGGSAGLAGEAFTLTAYGTQAYASGYKQAKERGATNEQAELVGIAQGSAEVLTEKLSLDHLWGMAKGGKIGKKLVVDWLMQAGIEGSEEVASDLLNRYSDYLILGEDGKNEQTKVIEAYMAQGLSKEEATKAAELDFWKQVSLDGLGGFVSGGILGAGGVAVGNMNTKANQALISDYYNSVARNVTGDTQYEQDMKAQAQQYADNPIRLMADTIDDSTEIGRQQKAEVMGYADKYAQNGKLSAQDNFALNRSMEIAEEARTPQEQYEQYLRDVSETPNEFKTAVTGTTVQEGRSRMQEAIKNGDVAALSAAYNAMKSSTSSEARNNADEALSEFSDMARAYGFTDQELESVKTSAQDAYTKALRGESRESMGYLSETAERAFKEGEKARIESNNAVFHESNETTVNAVNSNAAMQKTEGAKTAYVSLIKDGTNLRQYDYAFNKYYNAGATGVSYESAAKNGMGSIVEAALGKDTVQAMYDAGRADYEAEIKQQASNDLGKSLGVKKGTGSFQDVRRGSKADLDTNIFDLVAKVTGLDIVLTNKNKKGVNGSFNVNKSLITISEDHATALNHELAEFAEVFAGDEYGKLRDMVVNAASTVLGSDGYQSAINAYQRTYEKIDANQTVLESSKEFTNDMLVALMSTKQGQKAMADYMTEKYGVKEAQSLGTKIKDFFKKAINSIKSLVDHSDMNSYQKKMAEAKIAEKEQILDQFFKALDKAIENYQGTESTAAEGAQEIKFSRHVEESDYTYDTLRAMAPIKVYSAAELGLKELAFSKDLSATDIVDTAKENISRYNKDNGLGSNMLFNSDLGKVIMTGRDGMRHGLRRIHQSNANAVSALPAYFENAIVFNEADGNRNGAEKAYVMFGALKEGDNLRIVRMVINHFDRFLALDDVQDALYAIKTKEEAATNVATIQSQSSFSNTSSELSITQLMYAVKSTFPNDLSKDVAAHLEYARGESDLEGLRYSLDVDSEGNTLTQEQAEFFKYSKVRDKEGRLMVMHHGTNSYGFDVFDIKKAKSSGLYGRGFYFADTKAQSSVYGQTYNVYLNLVEPLQIGSRDITEDQLLAFINEIANDEDYGIDNYGYEATPQSVLESLKGKDDFSALQDLNASCVGDFVETLKIFNRVNGTSYDGIMAQSETVAFYPNQIKDVDNAAPTSADSIKYSLDVDEDRVFYVRGTEVVKNPTSKEYQQMREDILAERPWLRGTDEPLLRHTWDEEGNEYYWEAMGGLHAQIEPAINQKYNTRTSQQWQWWTREDKDDYPVDYSNRYSLSVDDEGFKAMEKAAKDTVNVDFGKNLIAVHNMTADQLMADIGLNGFPSPSVAIIRAGMEHSKYGDVSVLFKRETIDPKFSKKNKVYGGDAWTPTFPSIEVKINSEKAGELWNKFDELVPKDIQASLSRVAFDTDNMSDAINRMNGNPVEAYREKDALKYAFLKSIGVEVDPGTTDGQLAPMTEWYNDQIIAVAEKIGEQAFRDFNESGSQYLKDHPEFEEQVRAALNEQFREKYSMKKNPKLRKLAEKDLYDSNNFGFSKLDQIRKGVLNYYDEGIKQVPDYAKLRDVIAAEIESREKEYTDWLDSFFDGIVEKRGLRNEKDTFTYSGNRRSWEALHDEVTLENIVRIMNSEDAKGADGFFAQSAIQAIATKDFTSIEDIHANEAQLRMISEEEHSALTDDHSRRFTEIIHEIEDPNEKNGFISFDRAAEAIADAVRSAKTVKGIDKVLREYRTLNIQEDTAQKIVDLMHDIAELPTGYFEAKPRRAVWLNEIASVILPSNSSQKVFDALEEKGIQYKTYEAGNEDQRTKLLESESKDTGVRFSMDIDEAWESLFDETFNVDGASILEEGMQALKGQDVDYGKVKRIAIKLKQEYGSTINTKAFADMMEKAFAYMQTGDHVNYTDMMRVMEEIAKPVLDEATHTVGDAEYKSFINAMKGYKIKLNDEQMAEVKSALGSYADFKKAMYPLTISNNGSYLDGLWEEICASTGYLLDQDIAVGNQPLALMDVLESLRPSPVNSFDGDYEDVAKDLAMRIVEEYLGVQAEESDNKKSDKLKAKQGEYRQQVREKANERVAKARERMNKKRLEYQQKVKERYDQRLADVRQKMKDELKKGRYDNRVRMMEQRQDSLEKIAALKAKNKERAQSAREQRAAREQREKISKRARTLTNWIMSPTEQHHVPTDMMEPVLEFLNALDFVEPEVKVNKKGMYYVRVFNHSVTDSTGKRQMVFDTIEGDSKEDVIRRYYMALGAGTGSQATRTWVDRMSSMQEILRKVKNSDSFEHQDMNNLMQQIDETLADALSDVITRNRASLTVNNMSSSDLRVINNALRNIMHAINQGNKAFAQNEDIEEMGADTLAMASGIKNNKTHGKMYNKITQTLRLDMATPETYFTLLGEGGKKVYKALRKGFNTKVADIRKAQGFMQEVMEGVKKRDLNNWTGLKADLHNFHVTDGEISLTTAQIMSLYELNKRQQAVLHFKGGVEADTVTKKIGLGNRVFNQNATPVHLSESEIESIINTLTPQQKEIADKLQQYMAVECAKDGNETSMIMYGFEKFTDENYFPISTDKSYIAANNSNTSRDSLNGIERSGFTKQLVQNATNPIIIKDIFDVFTTHVADMATYHGFAPAMKDATRWFNYKVVDKIDEDMGKWNSVQKAIKTISGEGGTNYFTKLMQDLNGNEKSQYIGNFTDALISNYKAAAVGANIRVIIQQPTAYFRAMNTIDPQYLIGAAVSPIQAHKIGNKMREESEIAWWKSQGYFETSIGKSMKEIITGQSTLAESAKNISMAPAGWADDLTWGVLYTAVTKEQQAKARKEHISKEELNQRIKDRFDEVVDQTQVVDSTLHRSQYMRSKDTLNKLQTAFMAEPTKSYNMLMKAIVEDMHSGKGFKRTTKAAFVFMLTNVITSAAAAVIDAFRKDTDDTDWGEVYVEALKDNAIDNVNPLNLIPVLKDASNTLYNGVKSLITGESNFQSSSSNRMDTDAINSLIDAATEVTKYMSGTSRKTPYGMVMTLSRPLSQLTGIPAYNLARDAMSIYNAFMPDLKKTLDGNKYSAIYNAIKADKSVEEIQALVDKAMDEDGVIKDVQSGITSRYKSDYYELYNSEEEGDREKAIALGELAAKGFLATGMSEEETEALLADWQYKDPAYNLLDDAVESGEGIEDAVKLLMETKEPDKMIEHLVKGYGSTIKYNRDNDIDSVIEGNVNKALNAIEKGTNYDSAAKALEEKAAASAAKKQLQEEKKELKQNTYDILESGKGDYKQAVNEWAVKLMGDDTSVESQKDAASTIKSSLTTDYTKPLVKAYKNGDYSAQQMLIRVATIKAYIDEQVGTKIAKKYGGDYYQYELDQIIDLMDEYDQKPW